MLHGRSSETRHLTNVSELRDGADSPGRGSDGRGGGQERDKWMNEGEEGKDDML